MRKRIFTIVHLICQLLIANFSKSFGYIAAEDIDWEYTLPGARLGRSICFEQPVLTENYRREVINRLISYFRCPSSFTEIKAPVLISEGIGEVYVLGDDICTGGITEVEGTVPIGGSVSFNGPVRAAGSVTITGRCAPACGSSGLRIGQPIVLRPQASLPPIPPPVLPPPPPPPPVISPIVEVLPLPDYKPLPTCEYLPRIEPISYPTILPPVVIPALVIPAYVLPEVVIPASEVYELATGTGSVVIFGNDFMVNGATYVDACVPTLGEVTFNGYVPAKGSVTICSCF